MATNKTKSINNAQKYIQKGNFDKAIRELKKLIEEDPRDVRTLLKIGDIYTKKGDRAEATAVYSQVAEFYGEQGFFLKAVAVYKQILKYDPKNLEVTVKLAELYEHLGLIQEAMVQYQNVANFHEEAGRAAEALSIFGKMVDLDPENVASRVRLAEAYSRDGFTDRAIEHFDKAATLLKKQSREADYIKVAERLAYHAPARLDVLRDLAKLYLERDDAKRAIAKLQVAFKADPEDIDTLLMLGRAFRELGQNHKTVFVDRELARLYQLKGRDEDAKRTYERILELAPDDPDALEGLRSLSGGPTRTSLPPPPMSPTEAQAIRQPVHRSMTGEVPIMVRTEREESGPRLELKSPSLGGAASAGGPSGPAAASPGKAPTSASAGGPSAAAEIERLLTETDVYIKYGLRDKALEHLRRVATLDPDNAEAHTKMADLYIALGDGSRAAEALSHLVRIHTHAENAAGAEAIRERIRALAPGHPSALRGSVPPGPARPSELSIDIDLSATGEFDDPPEAPDPHQDLMAFSADLHAEEHGSIDGSISIDLLRLPDDEPLSEPRASLSPPPAEPDPRSTLENLDSAMVDLFRTGEVQVPEGLPTPFEDESSAVDVDEADLLDVSLSRSGLHSLSDVAEGDPAELRAAYARAMAAEAQVGRPGAIVADLVPSEIGPSDIPTSRASIPLDFEEPVDFGTPRESVPASPFLGEDQGDEPLEALPEDALLPAPADVFAPPPARVLTSDIAAELIGEPEAFENVPLAEEDAAALAGQTPDLGHAAAEPVTDTFTLLSSELEGDDTLLGLDELEEVVDESADPEVEEELDETDFLVEQGLHEEAREMLLELLSRVPLYPRAVEMLDRVEEELGLRRPENSGADSFDDDLGGLDEVFANAVVKEPGPGAAPSGAGNGFHEEPETSPEGLSPEPPGPVTKKNKITYL